MEYEIQDSKGTIFSGDLHDMSLAWDTNMLNNKAFKKRYGKMERPNKWIIEKWNGDLKLVSVIYHIENKGTFRSGRWFDAQVDL